MKKRVLSALLALCLTLSLAGAAFAENETLSPAQETSASESASSVAELQEEEESEVEAEEISTAETAQEPSYPAQDFEAAVDGADMTVNVSAPEGALPADVTLTASLVGSSEDNADDQAVADVAAELDDADVEYDGFVALDISFVDADGNKVEPLQPVSVNFTLPAELLPEDVDASTLEVQHLKENEAGEVEAVEIVADTADATEGTVTVDAPVATLSEDAEATLPADAEVAAEFTVDGFSIFTITFNWKPLAGDEDSVNINFVIKDTDGNIINTNEDFSYTYDYAGIQLGQSEIYRIEIDELLRNSLQGDLTTIVGTTESNQESQQYVFQTAVFVNGDERHPVNEIGFGRYKDGDHWSPTVGMRLYDTVFNTDDNERGYYTVFDTTETLELVYHREEDSITVVEEPSPRYTKKAIDLEDGTYNISLAVTGAIGNVTEAQKIDVLFVVDQSGSMADWNFQQTVAECASNLATSLGSNSNLDARFAVVTFGDGLSNNDYYEDAKQQLFWTKDYNKVYAAANQKSSGGTNYEAGLMSGRATMIEARPDAVKYVIFLSDGVPTYHYNNKGVSTGGGSYTTEEDINEAVNEASKYTNVNGFFTIRVGYDSAADDYLKRLSSAVQLATGISNSENFQNYAAEDEKSLIERFEKIESQITAITISNVRIDDILSCYVKPTENAVPYYKVYDEKGNEVENIDLPKPNLNGNYLTWELGDQYQLLDGYTYEVNLTVQPTDLAYTEYALNETYPKDANGNAIVGETDTGTYSEKPGFFSNDKATLKYDTDLSEDNALEYPMPVIQVPSTSITINKVFVKNDGTVLTQNEIESILPIDFTVKNGDEVIDAVQLTKEDRKEDGTYSVEVPNLVVTKTYTIEENSTSAQLSGYDLAVSANKPQDAGSAVASIVANKDVSQNAVTFTNTYTPQNKQLTVTKTVTGEMGSNDKSFDFTLSLTKTENGNTVYYGAKNGETIKVVSSNMEGYEHGKTIAPNEASTSEVTYSFKLKHGKRIVFDVPYGYTATLHEEADGYTATFTVDEKPVEGAQPAPVMDQNHTVAYTNRLDPVAPTGLEDNHTKPFGLMVGVAVMAGLALAGGAVVRRRRRWME